MYKRFAKHFAFVPAFLLCSLLVFAVDPFYYRAPKDYTKIIYTLPYYQNIGISKRFLTHDNRLVHDANSRANWFDDALGCKAINLCLRRQHKRL